MKFDDPVLRDAGTRMQPVDVLGDNGLKLAILEKPRQRQVTGRGLRGAELVDHDETAAPVFKPHLFAGNEVMKLDGLHFRPDAAR